MSSLNFSKNKLRKVHADNPFKPVPPREPAKRAALVNRAKRIAEGEERAVELGLHRLPKLAAFELHGYAHASQSRTNSKYLDSLLKRGNAKS
jgi:hypothetical protein